MQYYMQEGSDSRHGDDEELSPTPHLRSNPSPTDTVADSTTTEKRQQVGHRLTTNGNPPDADVMAIDGGVGMVL